MIASMEPPSIPIPTQRRRQGKRIVSPAGWVQAMEMFVSGQLCTHEAVAKHLGVSLYTVESRSKAGRWIEARNKRVEQLVARVSELPPLSVERSREGLEGIAKLQEELAKSLIGSASRLQAIRDNAAAVADSLIARLASIDPGANREGIESRLASVMSVSDSLSEQLRVLAGLPNPDKVRAAPSQDQPKQTQPKSRPEPTGPISQPIHASPVTPEQDQDSDE